MAYAEAAGVDDLRRPRRRRSPGEEYVLPIGLESELSGEDGPEKQFYHKNKPTH